MDNVVPDKQAPIVIVVIESNIARANNNNIKLTAIEPETRILIAYFLISYLLFGKEVKN